MDSPLFCRAPVEEFDFTRVSQLRISFHSRQFCLGTTCQHGYYVCCSAYHRHRPKGIKAIA